MKFEEIIENAIMLVKLIQATQILFPESFTRNFLKHSNTQVERNEFYSRAPLNPLECSSSRTAPNNNHRQ